MCCTIWKIVFRYLQRASAFLVMLLSVSRTIAITRPFCDVRNKKVLGSFVAYSLFLVASEIPVLWFEVKARFKIETGYCVQYSTNPMYNVLKYIEIVEFTVPPIVCFISFIASAMKLSRPACSTTSQKHNKTASTTIGLFTALYLLCNTPNFILYMLYTLSVTMYDSYPEPLFSSTFMFWYSWILGQVVFTVLNAVLNPVLYYCRMGAMKRWVSVRSSDGRHWSL